MNSKLAVSLQRMKQTAVSIKSRNASNGKTDEDIDYSLSILINEFDKIMYDSSYTNIARPHGCVCYKPHLRMGVAWQGCFPCREAGFRVDQIEGIDRILKEIEYLRGRENGWDGFTAEPAGVDTIRLGLKIVDVLGENTEVELLSDGSLEFTSVDLGTTGDRIQQVIVKSHPK